MSSDSNGSHWWESFYEDTPFELYLTRHNQAEVDDTIKFLTEKLHLTPGARIFDQCCGLGSMSIPLALAGFALVGVDLCGKYIKAAQTQAAEKGLTSTQFFQGDACSFVPSESCDAAFNWYTSFGYYPDDDNNRKMLERAFEALKPGTRFALDFANFQHIVHDFKPSLTSSLDSPEGKITIVRECTLEDGIMKQHWTFTMPDGRELVHNSELRAYMPADVERLFSEAGFVEVETFGNIDGEPLDDDSPRCIVVGRRPE